MMLMPGRPVGWIESSIRGRLDQVVGQPRSQRLLHLGHELVLESGTAQVGLDDQRDGPTSAVASAMLATVVVLPSPSRALVTAIVCTWRPTLANCRLVRNIRLASRNAVAERSERPKRRDPRQDRHVELLLDLLRRAQPLVQALTQKRQRESQRDAEDGRHQHVQLRLGP